MSDRAALQVIDGDDGLPEYPLPRDFKMPTHYFMAWWHNRFLYSDLHLKSSYEVQGVAIALFSIAQNQAPMGTLPNDDELIAAMLRMPVDRWNDLCRVKYPPLRNWYLCRCDDEIRWAHPVVLEMLDDAKERRETKELSKDERAEARRIQRLRQRLVELGLDKGLASDRILIEEMNEWLNAQCKGNRNHLWYGRALNWAAQQGHIQRAVERSRS